MGAERPPLPVRLFNFVRYKVPGKIKNARMVARLERAWALAAPGLLQREAGPAPGGAPVVVSLTSYPPRFGTLHLTLKSLLMQSLAAERVELWIARGDLAQLPPSVLALEPFGLVIKSCDDLRSYKKLVPALLQDSSVTMVTADDDIYYWHDWLRELVEARTPGVTEVICHRMHRIRLDAGGAPLPYADWVHDDHDSKPDLLHFPTGIGGVLYPAGVFGPQVLDVATFMALCPNGDDIWFYWMARTNGARFKRVPQVNEVYCWEGSQDAALWKNNMVAKFNDTQIAAMIGAFGFFDRRTAT